MKFLWLAFLGLSWVPIANGQIVRGSVTERESGAPIAGALVMLAGPDSSAEPLRTSLTNEEGRYALRAPASGRFRVVAKRIGVKAGSSPVIELRAGETREVSLVLDKVSVELPPVRVSAAGFCVSRSSDEGRVAALWEEARTALMATTVTQRDSLQRARIVSYSRVLDPRTLRVLDESRNERRGTVYRTFASLPADSLSKVGYWRELGEDTLSFFGPDVAVLLSRAFIRDHCFSLARADRAAPGFVGISFEPHPDFRPSGIRGTIWLKQRGFELSSVEFNYTRLPRIEYMEKVGGEVHFSRLPSGRWVIPRWYIRMPQYARYESAPPQTQRYDRARSTAIRLPSIYRLIEDGGEVFPEDAGRQVAQFASLRIQVADSLGAPIKNASLRIIGTSRVGTLEEGRVAFDSVPFGTYRMVVQQREYDTLGVSAAEKDVVVSKPGVTSVDLRAEGMAAVLLRVCGPIQAASGRGAARVSMRDTLTSQARPRLRLSWNEYAEQPIIPKVVNRALDVELDGAGSALFCGLPDGVPLELAVTDARGSDRWIATLRVLAGQLAVLVIPSAIR